MKSLIRQAFHAIITIGLSATIWFVSTDALWARPRRGEVEEPKEPSFAMGYVVLLIMLGLGLAVICRPSSRGKGDGDAGA